MYRCVTCKEIMFPLKYVQREGKRVRTKTIDFCYCSFCDEVRLKGLCLL